VSLVSGESTVGGGSAPGVTLPTVLLALEHPAATADSIEARLRAADPPVIARIQDDRVVLDLRTVRAEDDALLLASVASCMASGRSPAPDDV
jgi:L-seryl-tRNA(Ser) seleniumtransferase